MSDRLVDKNTKDEEAFIEKSLRPQSFNAFIGQKQVLDNLRVFIGSAKEKKKNLDHVLLYGPPGLGKTSIAKIISLELGSNFRSTSGPILSKAGDLAAILTNLEENDVLFIDEIHRLSPIVEEILYPAMEDFKLDLIIGEGPSAKTVCIDLPKFTLIGATTRIGLLTNPLRDRFGIPLRMSFYEEEDLKIIIQRAAKLIDVEVDSEGAEEISRRSRGTPRIALRLLKRVADYANYHKEKVLNQKVADIALINLEVDQVGLDSNDYRYLKFICEKYQGGPVGVDTIAAGMSEHKDSIEEIIEPFLLQQGFIQRTPRGRLATPRTFEHLRLSEPPTK
ncbi:MAG: Holliday junction branch migration DNA helicase RuvB [Rickettsiales bacterium]